ncbi:MAG: DMT family transporter [Bacillota bacterium]|jgi:drug/metabolite transporter (DMT)-like permease|nr:DMT family transporter [Bacillota bacterium]NLL59758.1 DMT family transporter [Tissierellia bacterium]
MDKTKGIVFGILSAFIYGFTPILGKLTFLEGSNTISLAFYRNLLSLPFIYLLLKYKKVDIRIDKVQGKKLAFLAALGPTLTALCLYGSYAYISVGMATTIHYIYPVLVAAASIIIFKEKISIEKLFALFLSTAGVALFFEGDFNIIGVASAFLSGIVFATHMLYIDKSGLNTMYPFKISFYLSLFSSAYLLAAGVLSGNLVFAITPKGWILTILVAFFVSFLANTFVPISIKYTGPTVTSIVGLFEPITSIIMGILFLREPITTKSVLACILILVGVFIVAITKEKKTDN